MGYGVAFSTKDLLSPIIFALSNAQRGLNDIHHHVHIDPSACRLPFVEVGGLLNIYLSFPLWPVYNLS